MSRLHYLQAAISLFISVLAFIFAGSNAGLSFLAGAAVTLINLAALVFSWPRILAKKLVALSIGVIVFKFAILGWILYEVVHSSYVHLGWFAGGLATVVISVVATALRSSVKIP